MTARSDSTIGSVSPVALRRVLKRAHNGQSLNHDEAVIALSARGEALEQLCASASRVRDAGCDSQNHRRLLTYSSNIFIPLTRLCRDQCRYCSFVRTPTQLEHAGQPIYLSEDDINGLADRGAQQGCREALFTLGDHPETRWSQAQQWLTEHGYTSTVDYVYHMAHRVSTTYGLLPHLNLGVLSWDELSILKPVAVSMGMMLETTSSRLYTTKGLAHYHCPDKNPEVRLRTLTNAGRLSIPFTTGLLIGIGETLSERVDTLYAIDALHKEFGHIQEVIIQNFRAKPHTPMSTTPHADIDDILATIAVARLIFGPEMPIQTPPNLVDSQHYPRLIHAGMNDWGGISPITVDHVNPECPWPSIEELKTVSADQGYHLVERLAIYPRYLLGSPAWTTPALIPLITRHADPITGLARSTDSPEDLGGVSQTVISHNDHESVFGSWEVITDQIQTVTQGAPQRFDRTVYQALQAIEAHPGQCRDHDYLALAYARGHELETIIEFADQLRADRVGEEVSYVINRNINFTTICYTGCRFCAFAQRKTDRNAQTLTLEEIAQRTQQAWEVGATEVCVQGGINPDLPPSHYIDILTTIKQVCPSIHIHAFSPMEIITGAHKSHTSIHDWLVMLKEAGLGSIPGTAAEILDDEIRWILTKGKLPTASWVEVITTAHQVGIPTTSTMMYGHIDQPHHWVAHLRLLRSIQENTAGFTEFVPLPFIHHNSPLYLSGKSRPGPTHEENRLVYALGRIILDGAITNIQTSWVKLGPQGAQTMLQGGANDLGGTLMEETISRMAGSQYGSAKTVNDIISIATDIGRPTYQRTTDYQRVLV